MSFRLPQHDWKDMRSLTVAALVLAGCAPFTATRVRADAIETTVGSAQSYAGLFDSVAAEVSNSIRMMVNTTPRLPQPMPAGSSSSSSPGGGKGEFEMIMGSGVDPHFERWQKDADEKLKAESQIRIVKPHPLALAHPGKSVVVCEAGCRTTKDEIVYIAVVVPAVLPQDQAQAKMETTSSGGTQVAELGEGEVPCIAGCYVRPERNKPAPRRRAETDAQPAQKVAEVPAQTAGQRYADAVKAAMHTALAAAPAPDAGVAQPKSAEPPFAIATAHTSLPVAVAEAPAAKAYAMPAVQRIARVERGHNGAIVQTRQTTVLNRSQRFASAPQRASKRAAIAVVRGWTVKVTAAPGTRPAPRVYSASSPKHIKAVMRTRLMATMTSAARMRRASRSAWQVRIVEY